MRGITKIDAWHYQTICVALLNYLRSITKPMRGNTNTPKDATYRQPHLLERTQYISSQTKLQKSKREDKFGEYDGNQHPFHLLQELRDAAIV
jgi:hypothetical protein